MRKTREILRQKWLLGRSHRDVCRSLGLSVGLVSATLDRAQTAGLTTWESACALSDRELETKLYGPGRTATRSRPDPVWIHTARQRKGVTLELLHHEYLEQHPDGYRYTQFCEYYRRWCKRQRLSMRQVHRAGEKLFDDTVKRALDEGLVSDHVSADGTLVRANTSFKSFIPIELAMNPAEYKRRLRAEDRKDRDGEGPQDPGNRAVDFRGEKRGNATHRSATDPDCRFASKGTTGTGSIPGYTVNALMENRHRILLGFGVEIFRSSVSETEGCRALLDRPPASATASSRRRWERTRATSASR